MSDLIPLSVPSFKGNEWQYVKECIDTEWVSSAGKYVGKFEEEICRFTGAKYAVACVNGTAALHIALKLAGVESGDEVIVPTVTFIAPVNVVKYLNADPIFIDCDEYYNIDTVKVIDFIKNETEFNGRFSHNKKTGKRVSAIIPVHVFGNAVRLENLLHICNERNIKIVEDATESLGTYFLEGSLEGKFTGTVGDIGCFSFNGNKIITTGGGGMIVTNSEEYASRAKYLTTQAKDDEIRYIHGEIGYNYRLTNIQAALGVAQMERLPEYLEIKKKNYIYFKEAIDKIPGLLIAEVPDYSENNHWMYALRVDKQQYGKDVEQVISLLSHNKIQSRPLWYLNHLQKSYENSLTYKIELAYHMLASTVNIPCSTNLTKDEIQIVVDVLGKG